MFTVPLDALFLLTRFGERLYRSLESSQNNTVVMLLVIGKEKIFTLYNESTEIFYDVYSETVVS